MLSQREHKMEALKLWKQRLERVQQLYQWRKCQLLLPHGFWFWISLRINSLENEVYDFSVLHFILSCLFVFWCVAMLEPYLLMLALRDWMAFLMLWNVHLCSQMWLIFLSLLLRWFSKNALTSLKFCSSGNCFSILSNDTCATMRLGLCFLWRCAPRSEFIFQLSVYDHSLL